MLTINNPDDAEKRQNVKPLTVEEEYMSISFIHNLLINLKFIGSEAVLELVRQVQEGEQIKLLQRLIHNYENYRHFFEVVGGWDGLSKLQERVISTPFDGYSNKVAEMLKKGIETIKIKNNDTSK